MLRIYFRSLIKLLSTKHSHFGWGVGKLSANVKKTKQKTSPSYFKKIFSQNVFNRDLDDMSPIIKFPGPSEEKQAPILTDLMLNLKH